MALQFENPWLLLLLLPAAAFMYYTARNMIRLVRWRKVSILFLRGIVLLLIILLLSGVTLQKVADTATTLFLVDSSDSIGLETAGAEFVQNAVKHMGRNDEAGIINFGGDSSIEILPVKNLMFDGLQTRVDSSFTNLEDALVLAQSVMPWDHQKRVVLLTDGRENTGNALPLIKQMKSKGYAVDIFPLSTGFQEEVQLKGLKVPDSVNLNEQFEITVNIKSNVQTKAVLRLYSERLLTSQKEVVLNKGDNQFVFSDKAVNGGMVTYRVEVSAESDSISQNNQLSSYTYVQDKPEIMLIQDADEAGGLLADILKEDMKVTVVNPKQVPVELAEILKFDAFILANVSADSLSETFLGNLETAVSYQGKGLLVTGGDNSYGPGGYYKTALEKMLPVNMDIKPKEEEPNLALMLVIDKSGSMSGGDYGISKMELAREAAIRSTEVLNKDDRIGVLAFDDAYKWVVEPQGLDDLTKIQNAIGSIRSGGGTQILPPLEVAYDAIQKLDTKLKHIILLTDGQAEKSGYEPLIEGLRENGITLSTVAVGRSADSLLMKALAYGGRGRYYETDEFTDIPKIFAKEVFLAGKKYLTNRTFTPKLAGSSDILQGIEAVPDLDGYVTTTGKETATIIFESDEKDPVLASWQYGLGRTIAWTPDVQGIWTYDWMNWGNTAKFWKNTVSWLVQQDMSKGYVVESKVDGKDGSITVKAEDDAFMTANDVKGTLVGPEGARQDITLMPGAPGEYTGTFTGLQSGVYIADITLSGKDGRSERISTGMIIPYSPEYDLAEGSNDVLLQKFAYEGGGRILDDPAQVFDAELPPVTGKTDPAQVLFITVLALLMLDIALRRINLRADAWKKKLEPVMTAGKATAEKLTIAAGKVTAGKTTAVIKNIGAAKIADTAGKAETAEKAVIPREANAGQRNKEDRISAGRNKRLDEGIRQTQNPEKQSAESHISQLLDKKRKWKR